MLARYTLALSCCFPGVAPCSESKGPGNLWHVLPPSGSHVHGHDLHQQGPAAHERLRCPVQQEQVWWLIGKECHSKLTSLWNLASDNKCAYNQIGAVLFYCFVFFRLLLSCSFGVIPTSPLPIHTPLMPSQSIELSLPINTIGPVMKMDPLNNLQVQEPKLSKQGLKLLCVQTFPSWLTPEVMHEGFLAVLLKVWAPSLSSSICGQCWHFTPRRRCEHSR